jgi:large subunit ribosomal protein L10
MERQEKLKIVESMHEELKGVERAFLFDYRGLNVDQVTRLRKNVKEVNSNYKVIKNTLAKRAIKDTPLEALSDSFVGPIAVTWTKGDPISLAKTMMDFADENKELKYKSGILSGKLLDFNEFVNLSKLPGKQELLAKLVYVLASPMRGFVTSLNEIIAGFARVLSRVKEKKES